VGYELRRWLADHLPAGCTPSERLVALELADRARDGTRQAWPTMDDLVRWTGLKNAKSVGQALKGLADKGWELRVSVGVDGHGRPVYAFRGHRTTYRIPTPEEVRQVTDLTDGLGRQVTGLPVGKVRQESEKGPSGDAERSVTRRTKVRQVTDPNPHISSSPQSSSLSSETRDDEDEESSQTNGGDPLPVRLLKAAGATPDEATQLAATKTRELQPRSNAWWRTVHANGDMTDWIDEYRGTPDGAGRAGPVDGTRSGRPPGTVRHPYFNSADPRAYDGYKVHSRHVAYRDDPNADYHAPL
jgi:hypothetical protein